MVSALVACAQLHVRSLLAIGTHADGLPPQVEWHEASHPVPDQRSVAAARRALQNAASVDPRECLLLLLSGGASALMALPADGLTLDDKQHAVRTMLLAGADIHALNTVRKHLSAVKGGRLAAACRGTTLTLAVSDVLDNDLSVIGSGPGVADASTWADAAAALARFGGEAHTSSVRALVERGARGEVTETPKPGDQSLARARAEVIGSRSDALSAARMAAERLGYHTVILEDVVRGEAREAAPVWLARARRDAARSPAPTCVLSAGETTVRVTGGGRGGRNQEFVLALVDDLEADREDLLIASIGTDGIDGPTDAAGALADRTTHTRAQSLGLQPRTFLQDNNSYDFFALLGDLIHLGRTDTNVGDVQVLLSPS
jgi:glycerate 2-kinase